MHAVATNVKLDKTAPTTNDDYDGLWHISDITIILTVDDELSGVTDTLFRINDGPLMNVSFNGHPLIVTEGSNNTLEYWSLDAAGNVESHHMVNNIRLDKTKPIADTSHRVSSNLVVWMVAFDASESYDNMGIVSYQWNFGDGTTATDQTVTHTYTTPGAYNVTLTVQDGAGNTDMDSTVVTILRPTPFWWTPVLIAVLAVLGVSITITIGTMKKKRIGATSKG